MKVLSDIWHFSNHVFWDLADPRATIVAFHSVVSDVVEDLRVEPLRATDDEIDYAPKTLGSTRASATVILKCVKGPRGATPAERYTLATQGAHSHSVAALLSFEFMDMFMDHLHRLAIERLEASVARVGSA